MKVNDIYMNQHHRTKKVNEHNRYFQVKLKCPKEKLSKPKADLGSIKKM